MIVAFHMVGTLEPCQGTEGLQLIRICKGVSVTQEHKYIVYIVNLYWRMPVTMGKSLFSEHQNVSFNFKLKDFFFSV